MKTVLLFLNVFAALAAFIAALYWFKASQTKLPGIDKASGKPTGQVSMLALTSDFIDAARRNRIAACWSGAAAFLAGITLVVNAILDSQR